MLADTGINIDIAENGMIAVDLIRDNTKTYNIVLKDVQMPIVIGIIGKVVFLRTSYGLSKVFTIIN